MTQAQRTQCHIRASMYAVLKLLQWTEEEYCWYKYKSGLAYLNAVLQNDVYYIDQMSRNASFWGWWKLHWHFREVAFCNTWYRNKNFDHLPVNMLRSSYNIMNNPNQLARANTHFGSILEDSYCKNLVNELKKEHE